MLRQCVNTLKKITLFYKVYSSSNNYSHHFDIIFGLFIASTDYI